MMSNTDETDTSQTASAEAQAGGRPSGPRGSQDGGREGLRNGFDLDLDDGDIEADLFFGRD
jgi:hypothetical protein